MRKWKAKYRRSSGWVRRYNSKYKRNTSHLGGQYSKSFLDSERRRMTPQGYAETYGYD